MKKIIISCLAILMISAVSFAIDYPVFEFYGPNIRNTWEQWRAVEATLEIVPNGTDAIPDPASGDGTFGKMTAAAPTDDGASAGLVIGDQTEADYTIQGKMYLPLFNDPVGPVDDYLYQMFVFYKIADGSFGRFHVHFNTIPSATITPRIRVQIANPSFVYTKAWTSAASDFPEPTASGWHDLKIVISGTTATCYYDGTQLPGIADWTVEAATRNAGQFGFGEYIDETGTRSLYIDQFKVYKGTEPADPTPTPTPSPTPVVLNAKVWSHYE